MPIKGFSGYCHYMEKEELTEVKKKSILSSKINEILRQVKSLQQFVPNKLVTNNEGFLEYKASSDEYVSTRTYGDYMVVSRCFLCLCAYTNVATGKPYYSLFDPEDIYIIAKTDNDDE